MHIPENYLSPTTCGVMGAAMVPVWVHAVKKVNEELPKEKIPLIGVGAAFSFLGMMFNVPLVGGTTGHAVGGTLIALLFGPNAACIAVSIALLLQAGHEKKRHLPALFKLFLLVALIVITSVTQNRIVLMTIVAGLLAYLCTWPAKGLAGIFKTPLAAAALAFVLFIPAMIMNPAGIPNNLVVVAKVFICVTMVTIFNHTTQWNHVTLALRKIHVPGIFVFTLDITLKYIVLLGNLIQDLLTSMQFRAVGKHDKKYASIGGVMGVTFIRGTEMNEQMYEAMRCRGFTDDYKGL